MLAGPGSGKTAVLTERIRYLIEDRGVKPEEILVITFSQKSAKEMQSRFINLVKGKSYPVNFGTFHAVFYHILMTHRNFTKDSILTDKQKHIYLMEIGIKLGIEKATYTSWQNEMIELISNYKNIGETAFENDELYPNSNDIDLLKKVANLYEKRCRLEDKLDFDDMIVECRNMLYRHEKILRKWQNCYKYICIDEFQDINDIQYDVLRLLAGDNMNVFAVGDDDQSIYAFRGSKPELMQKFQLQFVGCKTVYLSTNYRCANNIIGAADTLIRHNSNRILRRRQESASNENGLVSVIELSNTTAQAEYICELILKLKSELQIEYKDFAVLYRSAHCGKMFETVSKAFSIPISSTSNKSIFDYKEMKLIVSYFRLALGKAEKSDYFLTINNPQRNISREVLNGDTNKNRFDQMLDYYSKDDCKEKIIEEFRKDVEFIKYLDPYSSFIYLLKKVNIFRNYEKSLDVSDYKNEIIDNLKDILRGFDSIEGFLDFVNKYEVQNNKKRKLSVIDAVNMMTVHASKGLEFEVVFVIGLQEGQFPHNKNLHADSVEEERRLMYVAMTRAKKQLYLMALGIEHGKQKSRFISEIMENQSFISSYSSLSKNSSKASATASYSSSSSI